MKVVKPNLDICRIVEPFKIHHKLVYKYTKIICQHDCSRILERLKYMKSAENIDQIIVKQSFMTPTKQSVPKTKVQFFNILEKLIPTRLIFGILKISRNLSKLTSVIKYDYECYLYTF